MGDQHRSTFGQRRTSPEGQLTSILPTLGRGVAALAFALGAGALHAQTTRMPSTLRYGSGLLDVPVASVLPHLSLVTNFSGFWTSHDTEILTNDLGVQVGERPFKGAFRSDASITLGLFGRLEIGTSLQAFEDEAEGGDLVGAFGRLLIFRPEDHGIGLAVGGRFLRTPDFGDGVDRAPGRLGGADIRLLDPIAGEEVGTEVTLYAVASAMLRGLDSDALPLHDVTVSAGWGTGMFQGGDRLPWYEFADSEGWFGGVALHIEIGEHRLLNLIGEWNGFDVNVGAQLDLGGLRVGAHVLGVNYSRDLSVYRSTKFGILGSVALCFHELGTCRPELLDRSPRDTLQLPAPPPDTVVVSRTDPPPLGTGRTMELCLASGVAVDVLVMATGDTLVGPDRVPLESLRPGLAFAGTYAGGLAFYEADDPVRLGERTYGKSRGLVRVSCGEVVRIGEYAGVPLFAERGSGRPPTRLYVPVRPGLWHVYEVRSR
ncbi:MAG: hypothetical protein IH968_10840 [Gemmatimonadetes bacterium]|nr:hypothetical protein [Gemmatimonadota bacterium]